MAAVSVSEMCTEVSQCKHNKAESSKHVQGMDKIMETLRN
jgi:hypothetical protein